MKELNNFQEQVMDAKGYILLDFFAEWCGPCKQMTPNLEALSAEMHEVTIYKVNIDDNHEVATKHTIRSVPTLIFLKDGKILDRKVGYMDKNSIEEWLKDQMLE
jgi:thioredoxin 1